VIEEIIKSKIGKNLSPPSIGKEKQQWCDLEIVGEGTINRYYKLLVVNKFGLAEGAQKRRSQKHENRGWG